MEKDNMKHIKERVLSEVKSTISSFNGTLSVRKLLVKDLYINVEMKKRIKSA